MRAARAIAAILGATCSAQVSSTVSLSNGVQVRIFAQPPPDPASGMRTDLRPATGSSFYRIYWDQNGLAVFAYEVGVERTSEGRQFRITARPAGDDFAGRFPNADAGKPVPTLSEPRQSSLLNPGERFMIDIPTDPGLAQNIQDVVQVQVNQRVAPSERDSSGPLHFAALQVRADGRLLSSAAGGAVVAGPYVMFYIPGRGAYFFSTEPVSRRPFLQIGIVEGSTLRFTLENVSYVCQSAEPILAKAERGQIWVYHDPDYRSAGNWTKSDASSAATSSSPPPRIP
ncbi:MAG TPA: hypothetical protein VKX49_07480 [Bryobacteraceae bacterium]|nr:hypothetical protein [Bryobacteraceae bacterium]